MFDTIYSLRLPSSSVARGALVAVSVAGFAAAATIVIERNKSGRKLSAHEDEPYIPHLLSIPFYAAHRKHWRKPTSIAISTKYLSRRYQNSIGWYEQNATGAQDIQLRGVKEHSIAVEKYLNEQNYIHIPPSLGAPHRLDFTIAPRRISDVQQLDLLTVGDLKNALSNLLENVTPRTHQLCITDTAHNDCIKLPNAPQRQTVLLDMPKPEGSMNVEILQQNSSLLSKFINATVCDMVAKFGVSVDFRLLLKFGIPPPGFASCILGDKVVPLQPYEEPPYGHKRQLRPNAPRPTDDYKERFVTTNDFSSVEVNIQLPSTTALHELTYSSYHEGQKHVAAMVKERAERGESYECTATDIPDGADYILHPAFTEAYTQALKEQQMQQRPGEHQLRFQQHPEELEMFQYQQQEAQSYWLAHPDEYARYFPSSESSSDSMQSPPTPASELSFGFAEYNEQSRIDHDQQYQEQHYENHAAILEDPAVIHAVVRCRTLSQPTALHGPSAEVSAEYNPSNYSQTFDQVLAALGHTQGQPDRDAFSVAQQPQTASQAQHTSGQQPYSHYTQQPQQLQVAPFHLASDPLYDQLGYPPGFYQHQYPTQLQVAPEYQQPLAPRYDSIYPYQPTVRDHDPQFHLPQLPMPQVAYQNPPNPNSARLLEILRS